MFSIPRLTAMIGCALWMSACSGSGDRTENRSPAAGKGGQAAVNEKAQPARTPVNAPVSAQDGAARAAGVERSRNGIGLDTGGESPAAFETARFSRPVIHWSNTSTPAASSP